MSFDTEAFLNWGVVALLAVIAYFIREAANMIRAKMSEFDMVVTDLTKALTDLTQRVAVSDATFKQDIQRFSKDVDNLGNNHRELDKRVDLLDDRVAQIDLGGCNKRHDCKLR